VAGVVTNLQPELVDRGLVALKSEIARRQAIFAEAKVRDIWAYNHQKQGTILPHLWLLLDEFAKGLTDFPELNDVLDLLVRQGRSLGMYLLLANQDVNSSVDKLLSNVGWRIALKVARQDEIARILENKRSSPVRPGHGYLRSLNGELFEFQAGYSGFPLESQSAAEGQGVSSFNVASDGTIVNPPLYNFSPSKIAKHDDGRGDSTEQEYFISLIDRTSEKLKLKQARKIYRDPLSPIIPLSFVQDATPPYRFFKNGTWSEEKLNGAYLSAPVGYVDYIADSIQEPLVMDYQAKDGHLWVIGATGSGKEMTLSSLILSLAESHTPDEVHFYVLEFGSGTLLQLEALPHTGGVVRISEKERLQRLFNFIEDEVEERKEQSFASHPHDNAVGEPREQESKLPHIFLVINNFSELSVEYPEFVDQVASFVQGGKVGVHLVISSTAKRGVPSQITNNIARKIILEMTNQDEYFNLLNQRVSPLSLKSPGRGYWVDDGVAECQVARPELVDNGQKITDLAQISRILRDAWIGDEPHRIEVLAERVDLSDLVHKVPTASQNNLYLPIGISYDDLSIISSQLFTDLAQMIVIGEARSGKSNFLMCIAESVSQVGLGRFEVISFALRPSPLRQFTADRELFHLCTTTQSALETAEGILSRLNENQPLDKPMVVLIDDLGSIFEPGKEEIARVLDQIGLAVLEREAKDVCFVAAGMLGEFRMSGGLNTFVRNLGQNNIGLSFSQELQDWSWLGAQAQAVRPYQRLQLVPGRGYFIQQGQIHFLQTPKASS